MNKFMKANKLPEKLKALRTLAGLTQKEVGQFLNRSESLISYVEKGERNLETEDILKLARLFKVNADYFFETQPKTASVISLFRADAGADNGVNDFMDYVKKLDKGNE
jgi:transcriptional regulator with XRE-family HTH domain